MFISKSRLDNSFALIIILIEASVANSVSDLVLIKLFDSKNGQIRLKTTRFFVRFYIQDVMSTYRTMGSMSDYANISGKKSGYKSLIKNETLEANSEQEVSQENSEESDERYTIRNIGTICKCTKYLAYFLLARNLGLVIWAK